MLLFKFLQNLEYSVSTIFIYRFYESNYYDDTFIELLYNGVIDNIPYEILNLKCSVYYINKCTNVLMVGVES